MTNPLDSFNPEKAKCSICKEYFDKSNIMNTNCIKCFFESKIIITARSFGKTAIQGLLLNHAKKQFIGQF
jgi:hypothetical protein